MIDADLIAAIKTHWDGDATLTALDLWYGKVPENSTFPCATVNVISSNLDTAFGVRHNIDNRVQISLFAESIATLKTYLDALNSRFDRTTALSLTGSTFVSSERILNLPLRLDGISKDSQKVYHGGSQFMIRVTDSF